MDVSKIIFAFLFKIEKSKALHFRESYFEKSVGFARIRKALDIGEIRF